ncbi:Chitinase 4 [Hypoxylon texense]
MASQLPEPVTTPNIRTIMSEWVRWRKRSHSTGNEAFNGPGLYSQLLKWSDPKDRIVEAEVIAAVDMRIQRPPLVPVIKKTGLPNLEDVTKYGVSEEAQHKLWKKEASRLVEVVGHDAPLEFKGSKGWDLDTKASYENLAVLADRVWQAMNIVLHDGENALAEHAESLCREEILRKSRKVLDYICSKDGNTEDPDTAMPYVDLEDYFKFVDYLTAVLARIICDAIDGKSLYITVLAHLARISTKLKVVSAKPRKSSQISIRNSNRSTPLPNHNGFRGRQEDKAPSAGSLFDSSLRMLDDLRAMGSDKLEEVDMYLLQCAKFRAGILLLIHILVLSLRGTNNQPRSLGRSYEICAMVYKTGLEQFRTLIYQDYNNNFLGSSDTTTIHCAESSFYLLNETVRHVHHQVRDQARRGSSTSLPEYDETAGAQISWSYSCKGLGIDADKPNGPVRLKTMGHVITVMIPLIMTDPVAIYGIEAFIDMAIFTEFPSEPKVRRVKPRSYGNYTAFFCLTTGEYSAAQQRRGPDDAKSLSNALVGRNRILSKQVIYIDGAGSVPCILGKIGGMLPQEDKPALERIQQHQRELDNISNKMKGWVMEEKGVLVKCKVFVYTTILLCALLVAGSAAAGMTIGRRIPGVDPSNIATYCWVLAAFVLLIVKSFRVRDWPWNDFLHGRVLCKSVSELSSVTGIGEQLILAKLLQDESISFLRTRGPYNTIFHHSSEDGFSIDRPISIWAMLLSGLIMIEVELARGRGLVCLDLRRGTKYGRIQNLGDPEFTSDAKFIYCNRLLDTGDRDTYMHTYDDANKIRLTKGNMTWLRAHGFYGNKHAEFT